MNGDNMINNSRLELKVSALSTMASGQRNDAWHWRNSDLGLYSSEKLRNILGLSQAAQSREDIDALQRVRTELEKRAQQLGHK
jgi:hypothetical protein